MLRNTKDLFAALHAAINGMTADEIKAAMQDKTSKPYLMSRMIRTYYRAEQNAPRFGYIGVGAISFAENRLLEFQRRIARI